MDDTGQAPNAAPRATGGGSNRAPSRLGYGRRPRKRAISQQTGGIEVKKIISLFRRRNYDGDRLVRNEATPGAEWVLAGEGRATRKWDGTSVLIEDGVMWKRYEVKAGKTPPPGFKPANDPDPVTGKTQGWVLVGDGPEDRWHREAKHKFMPPDGTWELVGPKVQGNPEGLDSHDLIRHGSFELTDVPRDYDGLRDYLAHNNIEGIVWHRDNGDMVKIKGRDFGIRRKFAAGNQDAEHGA